MIIQDICDLLDKYDKLLSVANSGSSDKSISSKYKFARRFFEYKLLKNFSIKTYVVPFASNQVRKEIRYTLLTILKLFEINYLRTKRTDKFSKEAIDAINEYLKEIPKRGPSFEERLKNNSLNIIGVSVGILSLIFSSWSNTIAIVATIFLIIGVVLIGPYVISHLIFIVIRYFTERHWYKKWMRQLLVDDLKNRIINELVELNDGTYVELETKYHDSSKN